VRSFTSLALHGTYERLEIRLDLLAEGVTKFKNQVPLRLACLFSVLEESATNLHLSV